MEMDSKFVQMLRHNLKNLMIELRVVKFEEKKLKQPKKATTKKIEPSSANMMQTIDERD